MSNLSLIRRVVPEQVQRKVGEKLLHLNENAPALLMGAGIVGFGVTVVLASVATLHVEDVLIELKDHRDDMAEARKLVPEKYTQEKYNQDLVYVYIRAGYDLTKLYAPAVIAGVVSVYCLTKSHSILTSRNAGLTAAYVGVDRAFKEYRKRVEAELGPEKELSLYHNAASDRTVLVRDPEGTEDDAVEVVLSSDPNVCSIYARFFDETNPNWVPWAEHNLVFLKAQQNWANEMLRVRGHVFLNEVYDHLGLERTKAGSVVGWVVGNGDNYIDFGFMHGATPQARAFVNGHEPSIRLDFNVDGVIYDKAFRELKR